MYLPALLGATYVAFLTYRLSRARAAPA